MSDAKNYSIDRDAHTKLDVFRMSTGVESGMSNDKPRDKNGSIDAKAAETSNGFARRSIYDIPCIEEKH